MCLSFLLRKVERTIISSCASLNALVVLGASDSTRAEILGTCIKAWKGRTPMSQAGGNHALLIPHVPLNLLCQLFLSCMKSQVGPQNFLMDEYGLRAPVIVDAVKKAIARK